MEIWPICETLRVPIYNAYGSAKIFYSFAIIRVLKFNRSTQKDYVALNFEFDPYYVDVWNIEETVLMPQMSNHVLQILLTLSCLS